jgi:hypothetical protein
MGAALRLYLGWRLFRLFRPLLGAGLIVATALALHVGRAPVNRSAKAGVECGAAAVSTITGIPHSRSWKFPTPG